MTDPFDQLLADIPLKQLIQAARAQGRHPDPKALDEIERIYDEMLQCDPRCTYLDFMITVITPPVLFEVLLATTEECKNCLRAAYAGRGTKCRRHSAEA